MFMVGWMNSNNDMTEQPPDVGDRLSAKGCEQRDVRVVRGYVENDPRPYGNGGRQVMIWKGRKVMSECARFGHLGGGREMGIVGEEVVKGLVHGSVDANNVARSEW